MKVLLVSEYFPPRVMGGGEISAHLLAKEVAKSGVSVHVLTSRFPGLQETEKSDGLVIHRQLDTGKDPASVRDNIKRYFLFEKSLLCQLKILQEKEGYDIIHCMNTNSISAIKLKGKIKGKFVLHVNSPVLFCPKGTLMYKDSISCDRQCALHTFLDCYMSSRFLGKVEMGTFLKLNPAVIYLIRKRFDRFQELIRQFDYYMPISTYMKGRLEFCGVEEKRIEVIYNLMDFGRFPGLKATKRIVPSILYLGEYSRPKGPQILIEALKGLKEPYEADFFGDGVLKEYLRKESIGTNIKINNKIDYNEVPGIIEKHDIVVIPSFVGEAFGRVAAEACASGRTVVASDVGGITDIIEDNKTGYLFRAGDVAQLRRALSKAFKQRIEPGVLRKEMIKRFSKEKTVGKVVRIYRQLCTK